MSTTTQPPKPKRRWYQFSLRTLLIVMTVAVVAFGGWVQYRRYWAGVNRDRVAAVEEAVAAIEKLDGIVVSESKKLRTQTWLEKQFDDPGGADDPVGVLKVTRVMFWNTETTDADLECLSGLTDLKELSILTTHVTDEVLELLKGLKSLEFVLIWDTKVTDGRVEKLRLTKAQQALPHCQVVQGLETIEH